MDPDELFELLNDYWLEDPIGDVNLLQVDAQPAPSGFRLVSYMAKVMAGLLSPDASIQPEALERQVLFLVELFNLRPPSKRFFQARVPGYTAGSVASFLSLTLPDPGFTALLRDFVATEAPMLLQDCPPLDATSEVVFEQEVWQYRGRVFASGAWEIAQWEPASEATGVFQPEGFQTVLHGACGTPTSAEWALVDMLDEIQPAIAELKGGLNGDE